MPSITHESLVALFRECPLLGAELLKYAGEPPPTHAVARLTAAEFADIEPPEYRADAVVRLDQSDGQAAEVLVIEIQLDRDKDKRFSWPYYVCAARARLRCPASVLVVTLDAAVAGWCAEPIPLGRGGSVVCPLVFGPQHIPRITDVDQARALPELAVLSSVAHGQDASGGDIGAAALLACATLDNARAALYADVIMSSLSEAARRSLENLMNLQNYEYQSEFARKYVAQGRAEGDRATLRRLLAQRFGELPGEVVERIEQAESDDLERWLDRVIPAATLADVFSAE